MNRRSNHYLTILLCAVIATNAACSTTTQRLGPSQAAVSHHGIEKGDTVLVRFANFGNARSSSRSEQIQITGITKIGISGIDENGKVVNADYGEIFQIEYEKVGPIRSDSPSLMRTGKVLEVVATVLGSG